MTKSMTKSILLLAFASVSFVACGSAVEVGESSAGGAGGSSPDAGAIACAEQSDCPADEPCLEWRCQPSTRTCVSIVPSNATCRDAGAGQ